jgi:hypothetical protein
VTSSSSIFSTLKWSTFDFATFKGTSTSSSFGWWLMAGGWFVLREKYCWLIGGWFVLREKYCWLVADKPSEHAHISSFLQFKQEECSYFSGTIQTRRVFIFFW